MKKNDIIKFKIFNRIANIREFIDLNNKYLSITEEELKKHDVELFYYKEDVLSKITGFGSEYCTLCKATPIHKSCYKCVYRYINNKHSCSFGDTEQSYSSIKYSTTIKKLYSAIKQRARMQKVLVLKYFIFDKYKKI